jgi:hypothetical protein
LQPDSTIHCIDLDSKKSELKRRIAFSPDAIPWPDSRLRTRSGCGSGKAWHNEGLRKRSPQAR